MQAHEEIKIFAQGLDDVAAVVVAAVVVVVAAVVVAADVVVVADGGVLVPVVIDVAVSNVVVWDVAFAVSIE